MKVSLLAFIGALAIAPAQQLITVLPKGTLNNPMKLASDAQGNVYVVDSDNHRVRKIAPDGTMTTFAGTGEAGMAILWQDVGDGGPATAAKLSSPWSIAVDAAGNVFIGDTGDQRIRKVDTSGTITTVAGGGFDALSDNIDAKTAMIPTPVSMAVAPNGDLYFIDSLFDRIRKIDSSGTITTVAGFQSGDQGDGGPASAAKFRGATDLAFDKKGNLYVDDRQNNRVRMIGTDGNINTVAGAGAHGDTGDGGPALAATFLNIAAIAVDMDGKLYIADNDATKIHVMTPDGNLALYAGGGNALTDGGAAGAFMRPAAFTVTPDGSLYFIERYDASVKKIVAAPAAQ